MAHHGYIPFADEYLKFFNKPSVLEVGIEYGITTFSMLNRLESNPNPFSYIGIDIFIQPTVRETLKYMGLNFENNHIAFYEKNSLDLLPAMIDSKFNFDLVFLDGDHNYYTVEKELNYLKSLIHKNSIIICDDYHGRWKDKDGFYSEKEHLKNSPLATKRSDLTHSDKQGVNNAIDDFLDKNPEYKNTTLIQGEPTVLYHEENSLIHKLVKV